MRRLALGTCLGLAALAAGGAGATPAATSAPSAVCAGINAVDVYFWPQGHPAVPEIGFPAFGIPHLELYRAHVVTEAGFLFYQESTRASWSPLCAPRGTPPAWGGGPASSTTTQQRLSCTLPGDADAREGRWTRVVKQTKFVRVKGKRKKRIVRRVVPLGGTFTLSAGAGALVIARIGAANSSLRWDTRYCTAVPLSPT